MNKKILGIDLGGTSMKAGLVEENHLSGIVSQRVNALASAEEVLEDLFRFSDKLVTKEVDAIGIGVPGLVVEGMVYDVVNIPSWKEIPLQRLMQERYQLPAVLNNDANCFALGEFYFGKGRGHDSMIGLTIGTGLGSGIIINKKLYSGNNGGAGEFGMISYLDRYYEYYASGQFFQNSYGISGETVFKNACAGDKAAVEMYKEMGRHLGKAIKTILYATDISLIILGGSVSKAYAFFSTTMWEEIKTFVFRRALKQLKIEVSELENSGILGAAALCLDEELS